MVVISKRKRFFSCSMTGKQVVEIIDLSPFTGGLERNEQSKEEVLRAWDRAFSTLGFAVITGHGVPLEDIVDIQKNARNFFGQEMKVKMRSCLKSGYGKGGFLPMGGESVSRSRDSQDNEKPPDIVESLCFLQDGAGNDVIPDTPVTMKDSVQRYCMHMQKLLSVVMEVSALALGLKRNFFMPFFSSPQNVLRLAYYPAQGNEKPKPNQMRYGAHTDYTGFTLLRPDDQVGGLEILLPNTLKWIPVDKVENCYIVNAGDLIQQWTNTNWISNLHRVVNPPPELGHKARLSVVYFTGPNKDAKIEPIPECCSAENPPKYDPVIAGEFLDAKLASTSL